MQIIIIALYTTIFIFLIWAYIVIRKTVDSLEKVAREEISRRAVLDEYEKDKGRLSRWQEAHPFGPISCRDRQEVEQLVTDSIFSYFRFCDRYGCLIDQGYLENLQKLAQKDPDD